MVPAFEIGYNCDDLIRMYSLLHMPLVISATDVYAILDTDNPMQDICTVCTPIQRYIPDLQVCGCRQSHLTDPMFQHRVHAVPRHGNLSGTAGR